MVISASLLSKLYKQYPSRRSHLQELLMGGKRHRELWALDNVSFQVEAGEAVGIIGDNGAGKSTLLKILCGTTFPTRGSAQVEGTVSGLLELGAGFHPEFSGRTNIAFSGALMGYDRKAVAQREDEIIAFSQLADFIDQPVKTYSSGMYLRLGFAVATGFDPDILIIDEALAVGDQGFQKRCTDRIMEFRDQGKTLLFCSHNLYQVRKLCRRTLWLEKGRLKAIGPSQEIVERYKAVQAAAERGGTRSKRTAAVDPQRGPLCRIESFRLLDAEGRERSRFLRGEEMRLEVWARFSSDFEGRPAIGISVMRSDATMIYTVSTSMDGHALQRRDDDLYFAAITFEDTPLLDGRYSFSISLTDQHNIQCYDLAEEAAPFGIEHSGEDFGVALLRHRWSRDPISVPEQPASGPASREEANRE